MITSVNEIKKNRMNNIIIALIIITAVLLIVVTTINVLDLTNKVNQGKFRIHDLAIMSVASVEEIGIEETDSVADLSSINLNVSQENMFTIYIAEMAGEVPSKAYITNVKCSNPLLMGEMYVMESKEATEKIDLKNYDNTSSIYLNIEKLDDEFGVSFYVSNINAIKGAIIPENTTYLVYDGRIFSTLNKTLEELKFDFSCDLIIVDKDNNAYKMKLNYKLPNDGLIESGISVVKKDISNLVFKAIT